ncbi:hypothetical protein [Novosphingobium sp.]|uniref:hypothetical protein n=1 Tax=Novosphingobium sp. TaxID=1874826 RepID=UPI00262B007F|nr:hypothetical protein [Novosphingobium sp.]
MLTTFSHPALRKGMLELISQQPYTHSVTLNADRELTAKNLRSIFGTFCARIDRKIWGHQRVRSVPSADRFQAIAFPEHLSTNAHLHCLADLSSLRNVCGTKTRMERTIRDYWLQSNRGAGSVDVQLLYSDGFGEYAMKDADMSDPVYFLSCDFHPK